MKFLLSLIFTLNVSGLIVVAQGPPPPPPPPLIYKTPEKSSLQEYIAPDKSFMAIFPGKPQINDQNLSTNSAVSYSVNRMGSNTWVLVNEFNVNIEDRLSSVYESVKANLLKQNFKFETEKGIKVDGVAGKEFSATDIYTFQRARIFAVGKRVYIVFNDVTNWHILTKYNKEKVDEFNNETDRFFDSFKILKQAVRKVGEGRRLLHQIQLDVDVAKVFPDSNSVNEALRFLMRIMRENQSDLTRK